MTDGFGSWFNSFAAGVRAINLSRKRETSVVPVTSFSVATLADLNDAIAAINVGGNYSAMETAYSIVLTADLTLTADILAIALAAGDSLSDPLWTALVIETDRLSK